MCVLTEKQILSMGDAFNNGVAYDWKITGFGRLPLVNSPSGNGEQDSSLAVVTSRRHIYILCCR